MKLFRVTFTNEANQDIRNITYYIRANLFAPLIAERFLRGIYARIAGLEKTASIYGLPIKMFLRMAMMPATSFTKNLSLFIPFTGMWC